MDWVCPICGNDYREVGVSNTETVYYAYNEEGGVFGCFLLISASIYFNLCPKPV